MSHDDFRFSKEQKELINAHIEEKFADGLKCPLCQSDEWSIPEEIFYIPSKTNPINENPFQHSVIALICDNCSNTILFNAVFLGVLKGEPDPVKQGGAHAKKEG